MLFVQMIDSRISTLLANRAAWQAIHKKKKHRPSNTHTHVNMHIKVLQYRITITKR